MKDLLQKLWNRANPAGQTTSKDEAKQRLKFLLIHDQVDLSPAIMDEMKNEILKVIAKYVDIDQKGIDFHLERGDGSIALVSSVPVRKVTERASSTPSAAPA
jgi:cell division topological specificity factor